MPDNNGRLDRIEVAIEKLTERHTALAHTVEILAQRRLDNLEGQ